jgi:hypothetical protein
VKKWAGDGRGGRAADAKCLSLSFFLLFFVFGIFLTSDCNTGIRGQQQYICSQALKTG